LQKKIGKSLNLIVCKIHVIQYVMCHCEKITHGMT
jgi:hypothetical protein